MKIISTFVPDLFAFKYEQYEFDELERLFGEWSDPLFLYDFFEEHKADLRYFHLSVEDAVNSTYDEVTHLRDLLLRLTSRNSENFDRLFQPLSPSTLRPSLEKSKAKHNWLRLYAIKIDTNTGVITGGAIKLTRAMQDRPHTKLELSKLNQCRAFLRQEDVFGTESFFEFLELI